MNSLLPNQQSKPTKKKTQLVWVFTAILFISVVGVYFINSIVETIDAQKRSIPKKTSRKAIKKNSKEWKDWSNGKSDGSEGHIFFEEE